MILILGILVWSPQLVVGKIRRVTAEKLMGARLQAAWKARAAVVGRRLTIYLLSISAVIMLLTGCALVLANPEESAMKVIPPAEVKAAAPLVVPAAPPVVPAAPPPVAPPPAKQEPSYYEAKSAKIQGHTIRVGMTADEVFGLIESSGKEPTVTQGRIGQRVTHHYNSDEAFYDLAFERTRDPGPYVLVGITVYP